MRDERLSRCFERKDVNVLRPQAQRMYSSSSLMSISKQRKDVNVLRPQEDADAWFNVMALHQNRHTKCLGSV